MNTVKTLQERLEDKAIKELTAEIDGALAPLTNLYGSIEHDIKWSIPLEVKSGVKRDGPVVQINPYGVFETLRGYMVQHLKNERINRAVNEFLSQVEQVKELAQNHES